MNLFQYRLTDETPLYLITVGLKLVALEGSKLSLRKVWMRSRPDALAKILTSPLG